jgi:hypothetical protein
LTVASGGNSTTPTAPTPSSTSNQLSGSYTGNFVVTSCVEGGSAAGTGYCSGIGAGGPHTLSPTQTGSNLSGTVAFGGLVVPVTGLIGSDGVVTLSGSSTVALATVTLTSWRGALSGSTVAGNYAFTVQVGTFPLPPGSVVVQGTFSVTR